MSEVPTVPVSRFITVVADVFAPGHLGELTSYLPFEAVDDVLEQTKTVQRRLRSPRGYFPICLKFHEEVST
ncbi:transposase domain-containing protein [Actinopolymorpha sp. B17G11]|uniref:transposase domain-containing protein n=1 Tax=Actinopolymorpha sp. B17G11 TaxID=3160861 RepID=UPI0032E51202